MAVEGVQRDTSMNEQKALKESYEAREENQTDRNRRQVADLQRKHQAEVDKIRANYNETLDNFRNESKSALSQREQKHMKEINDLQDTQRKKIAQMRSESQETLSHTQNSLGGDLERTKMKGQKDVERLTNSFGEALVQKDEDLENLSQRQRDESKSAYQDQAQRFNKRIDGQQKAYDKILRDKTENHEHEVKVMKGGYDQTLMTQKGDSQREKTRLMGRYKDIINSEREVSGKQISDIKEGYTKASDENKDRFIAKAEDLSDEYAKNLESLKDRFTNYAEGSVRQLKKENQNLRDPRFNGLDTAKRQAEKSRESMRTSMQDNLESMSKWNVDSQADTRDRYNKKISDIHGRYSKELEDTNFVNWKKRSEEKARQEGHTDQIVGQYKMEKDQKRLEGEKHKKHIAEYYDDKLTNQTEISHSQLESTKRDFERRLHEQRINLEKNQSDEMRQFRAQVNKVNVSNQEKYMSTVDLYENKIQAMQKGFEKQIRQKDDAGREAQKRQLSTFTAEKASIEDKYKQRLDMLKENHEKEIDGMKKRHIAEQQDWAKRRNQG